MKNKITHITRTERVWPERGLDGAALKWIAMCSMFIDHIGAVVLEYGLYYQGGAERMNFLLEQSWGVFLYPLSLLLRILGRPAFLIYCFLLVEGFVHTRDRKRYGRNLLLFGLISEIPFNLAVANRVFDPMYQNVFFELFIGFLILCWIERAEKRTYGPKEMNLVCLYTFIGCGAALLAGADYNAVGILIIVFLYRFRNSRRKQTVAAGVLGFIETLFPTLGAGALAAVPIWFYNGKRGKQQAKFLFYWFYPLHLFVLFLIRWYFLGIPLA